MSGARSLTALTLCMLLAACASNTAPGNDREAELDPPQSPAPMANVDAAIAGVETTLLHPQVITDTDLAAVTLPAGGCSFRFTRVDFPIFLYSPAASGSGLMKLNGKLAMLEGRGVGEFASGGVRVQVRAVAETAEERELHQAELILMLPEGKHERGYRGFAQCA